MLRAFPIKSQLFWALALGACLAASCDEKGVTSICPPLPLYQSHPLGEAVGAAGADSAEARAAFAAAVDAGCATAPTDFPFDASAGAGSEGGNVGTPGGR